MSTDKKQILLIDDESDILENLKFQYGKIYDFHHARDMKLAEPMLEKQEFDLILLDLNLENVGKKTKDYQEGLNNIPILKKQYPEVPIIIVTQTRDQDIAVEAMDKGANYFFWKSDFNYKKWQAKIEEFTNQKYLQQALKALEKERQILRKKLQEEKQAKYPFIGVSPQIQEIREILTAIAQEPENITVLLTGETGVGKEVAAHYFYAQSLRNKYEFVPVNLSAISKELFESTLFGHKKGAFTGANEDTIGYCQQADKGILFLDEIGEINLELQVKILRFLQDKEIRIVGDSKTIPLDVQIVTATNKDLKEAVSNKEFRSDLYQRLKAFPVHIPPLRERKEDIMPIVAHYLNVPIKLLERNFFTANAKKLFLEYNWTGNVRELVNTINYMKLQQKIRKREQFDEFCLPEDVLYNKPLEVNYEATNERLSHEENLALLDLKKINQALNQKSKKSEAAVLLGTDSDGLRYKIKNYFKKHPHLFKGLNTIVTAYKLKR
jgi:DNA-binding NtrC family response regulator